MNPSDLIKFFAFSGYQLDREAIQSLKNSDAEEVIDIRDACDVFMPQTLVITSHILNSLANFAPSQKTIITIHAETT